MINHLTGGPPDTPSLTLGVGLGRFHVTLRIHSVAVLWLSGSELPRTLPKTRITMHSTLAPVLSLSSGEQGEPRSARPLVVYREMLKLSRRAASPVEAPWCPDARLTREELPMEPESGSEGSSTVEPVQVTRTRTTTALLGAMLMHSIKRPASCGRRIRAPPRHHAPLRPCGIQF